ERQSVCFRRGRGVAQNLLVAQRKIFRPTPDVGRNAGVLSSRPHRRPVVTITFFQETHMLVDLKDGRCRSCDSQLEIVDADDISTEVRCIECDDTYRVDFMPGQMEGGSDDA